MIYSLLFLGIVTLSVILFFSMRKIKQYEEYVILWEDRREVIRKIIINSELKLKEIDYKGSFEADDEVGYFFTMLKETQKLLNDVETEIL